MSNNGDLYTCQYYVIFTLLMCMGFAGDKLVGEVSRLVVAEACVQALDIDFTEGQIYEINSVQVPFFTLLAHQNLLQSMLIEYRTMCFVFISVTIKFVGISV